jgi:benzoyl-CoA reductase/2-hydroxyglutaryl-CoA dehydratase subunit BcrC/BadD/HgdB
MLRLYDLWRAYLDSRVDFLDLPKISSPQAVRYLAQVLEGWALSLSQGSPRKVTTDGLLNAIRGMNRARAFFRELFRSLRRPRGPVPYSWIHARVRQWLARPTDAVLSRIRSEWESSQQGSVASAGGARVILTSTMLDQAGLIRIMEEAGLHIVADDECLGARHFDQDVRETRDPYMALAERYLSRWPCPRMKGSRERLAMLDRLLEETAAEGVVLVQLKFCDQSGFDIPLLKAHLQARGVPFLVVENDYGEGGSGQVRTRIEAFAEMLHQPWG